MNAPICPYCNQPSVKVGGRVLYPHRQDLYKLQFYLCRKCDAYTGTHIGTSQPKGSLANAELRRLRRNAHEAFDPIWREEGYKRSDAYAWLAIQMRMTKDACHIGFMNETQCKEVVRLMNDYRLTGTSLI